MSDSKPIQESDIIFPSAHRSIFSTLSELKRRNLSVKNRILSIIKDAAFVERVSLHFRLPLIANERCGSWYIRPDLKTGSAYFKSTDGHFGQWAFSLRRLNLQVLDVCGRERGCIIVDSTRRGKNMPDALSKTVPIWIVVINRLIFPNSETGHWLLTPEDVVSASENAQINDRIDDFVRNARSLSLDIPELRSRVKRPLRPVWITPDTDIETVQISHDGTHWPVVLCTASSRASNGNEQDPDYVQGAADDHESWAHGMDVGTLWRNEKDLLSAREDDLPALINELLAQRLNHIADRTRTLIRPTNSIFIADNDAALAECEDIQVVLSCMPTADLKLQDKLERSDATYIHLICGSGKLGSRQLRAELLKLEKLRPLLRGHPRILITCSTGKDVAVGVALAVICMYYHADGTVNSAHQHGTRDAPNKSVIRQRLSWIMVSMPDASPSRATLQSVNAFLMS